MISIDNTQPRVNLGATYTSPYVDARGGKNYSVLSEVLSQALANQKGKTNHSTKELRAQSSAGVKRISLKTGGGDSVFSKNRPNTRAGTTLNVSNNYLS